LLWRTFGSGCYLLVAGFFIAVDLFVRPQERARRTVTTPGTDKSEHEWIKLAAINELTFYLLEKRDKDPPGSTPVTIVAHGVSDTPKDASECVDRFLCFCADRVLA